MAKYGGGRGEGPLAALSADAPAIIKAATKQLGGKSTKVRSGALQLLQALVAVQPGSMQAHLSLLLPALIAILEVPYVSCILAPLHVVA